MNSPKANEDDYAGVDAIADQVALSGYYATLMATAGVLSAIALLTNSVPILIGSMVVAPALPPFGLIAFGLIAGRPYEAGRGLLIGATGLVIAFIAAITTTWLVDVTGVLPAETHLLEKPLLDERVHPGWYSVGAAVAAGVAGILALAKGKTDTIVGAVAALALVPAVGASAIALFSDDPVRAWGGLWLLLINIASLTAAGVLTLLVLRVFDRMTPTAANRIGRSRS